MARKDSSFCLVLSFFFVILLCNDSSSVDGTRVMHKRMLMQAPFWCITQPYLGEKDLQKAIDFYCGEPGVDCSPTLPGGPCFKPDTKFSHLSWALNSYLQTPKRVCPKDVGRTVEEDPSYGTCIYPPAKW